MPPTTNRLAHWEQLAGRTIAKAYPEGDTFVLELDGGHAAFRSRDASLAISAERWIDGATEDITDWGWLAGRRIVRLDVPILAEGHGEKSTVNLTFEDGEKIVLRSHISAVPVLLGP